MTARTDWPRQQDYTRQLQLESGEVIDLSAAQFEVCPICDGSGNVEDETRPFFALTACRECSGNGGWWTS